MAVTTPEPFSLSKSPFVKRQVVRQVFPPCREWQKSKTFLNLVTQLMWELYFCIDEFTLAIGCDKPGSSLPKFLQAYAQLQHVSMPHSGMSHLLCLSKKSNNISICRSMTEDKQNNLSNSSELTVLNSAILFILSSYDVWERTPGVRRVYQKTNLCCSQVHTLEQVMLQGKAFIDVIINCNINKIVQDL